MTKLSQYVRIMASKFVFITGKVKNDTEAAKEPITRIVSKLSWVST